MDEAKPSGQGDRVIAPGDCVVSIAVAAGHVPATLWDDPANADLKTARGDGEVLLEGDRVTVTPLRPRSESCTTGQRHVFRRASVPVTLTLVLEDEEAQPFASKKYELVLGEATLTGTTDDTGTITCNIPPSATRGTLTVWLDEPGLPSPWVHELHIGALQPKNSAAGITQRLANLGYTGEAVVDAFILDEELGADAAPDAVADKLVSVHRI